MIPVVKPLLIGSKIGILGGGQLGRMLALAGAELGFDIHIFEPEPDCPAGRVAAACTTAPWDDLDALQRFAQNVDVVTFEFENVPSASLEHIGAFAPILPDLKSLALTQDRLVEKQFINEQNLRTAPFLEINALADLHKALAALGPKGILKTRRFGYDGKGQIRVSNATDLSDLAHELGKQAWIFEGLVEFECEVSVVLARDVTGDVVAYDVTQNVHRNGILHTSVVPASIAAGIAQAAIEQASALAEALNHVGVLAVEFFVLGNGELIVNEIAPRVHNSGHWTQDGCNVCQFQQHIRAIAGWPLGDAIRHASRIKMLNLIGHDIDNLQSYQSAAGTFIHLYGKREARAGRKMGHINQLSY